MAMSFRNWARFTQTGKRKRETLLAGRKICIGFLALGSYSMQKSCLCVCVCTRTCVFVSRRVRADFSDSYCLVTPTGERTELALYDL